MIRYKYITRDLPAYTLWQYFKVFSLKTYKMYLDDRYRQNCMAYTDDIRRPQMIYVSISSNKDYPLLCGRCAERNWLVR